MSDRRAKLAAKRAKTLKRAKSLAAARKSKMAALRERRGKKHTKRRWWPWLLLALMMLLTCLCCNCGAPPPEPVEPAVPVPVEPAEPAPVEPPPKPFTGRIQRRDRPEYQTPPPKPLPWVASFRLQVSARSPRLAKCFVGSDRPGRYKWSANVEPVEGKVSEHVLEPMLTSNALSKEEKACVIAVLSSPSYRLAPEGRATPSRVGIVIEF